jgi:hypothetical protein
MEILGEPDQAFLVRPIANDEIMHLSVKWDDPGQGAQNLIVSLAAHQPGNGEKDEPVG